MANACALSYFRRLKGKLLGRACMATSALEILSSNIDYGVFLSRAYMTTLDHAPEYTLLWWRPRIS